MYLQTHDDIPDAPSENLLEPIAEEFRRADFFYGQRKAGLLESNIT